MVALVILLALILGGVAVVMIWGTWRYQAIVSLGKHAQEQAQAINREFPFTPPPPGQSAPEARWSAMLRVRERALAKVSPQIKQALDRLLDAQKASTAGLALDVLPLSEDFRTIVDAQMAALRGEQMSLSEYQWLLGLAIRDALKKGAEPPGVNYWGRAPKGRAPGPLVSRDPGPGAGRRGVSGDQEGLRGLCDGPARGAPEAGQAGSGGH